MSIPHVSASLLAADYANLAQDVKRAVIAGVDSFHFDMMDGHYVSNIALSPQHLIALRPHTSLPFSLHLELSNPDQVLDTFGKLDADIISFQWDKSTDPRATIQRILQRGAKVSMCVNLGIPLDKVRPYLTLLDEVLMLGVNPGFGGQAIDPGMNERVQQMANLIATEKPGLPIAVDGGVSLKTAPGLVAAGAQRLISGSALFRAKDMAACVKQMKGLP